MRRRSDSSGSEKPDTEMLSQRAISRQSEIPFDVENWHAAFAPVSFRTIVLPLTQEEAKAIIAVYRYRYCRADNLNERQQIALDTLRNRIAESFQPPMFVRLSSRSPKDAAIPSCSRYMTVLGELQSQQSNSNLSEVDNTNTALKAYFQVGWEAMMCNSADDVMGLLETSERVFVDLIASLEAQPSSESSLPGEMCQDYRMNVILREWETELKHDFEFRLFVVDGVLTATSQYNHLCYFDEE